MKSNLLLIFTRNPELGKCKTRLAAKVGDEAALEVYKFLLEHTVSITKDVPSDKQVYYSEEIWDKDIWDHSIFEKRLQVGDDLGQRMRNAFQDGFDAGYEKIIIIGSDMYDLDSETLELALERLDDHDFVIGPALDGGYYLLGMKSLEPALFENKNWGTSTVLSDTLGDVSEHKVHLFPKKNDVDHYEDIKDIEVFQPFLKHMKQ